MGTRKVIQSQLGFDFSEQAAPIPRAESPPKPPEEFKGKLLDAEGHNWWARYCRNGHDTCIANAGKDPGHAKEWAEVARIYKEGANQHEARAQMLTNGSVL